MFSFLFGGAPKKRSNTSKTQKTKRSKKSGGNKSCPPGEILRSGYKTKKGTYVKPVCIEDRGKPGKGPKILPPIKHPGSLKKFGYKLDKPAKEREAALRKAIDANGAVEIIRKLNWVRVISRDDPKDAKKFTRDMKYVQKLHREEKAKGKKANTRSKSKKLEGGSTKKRRTRSVSKQVKRKTPTRKRKLKSVLKKKRRTVRRKRGGRHVSFRL